MVFSCCRLEKLHYSLDLSCLLQLDITSSPSDKLSSEDLNSTPYAHLIASALLTGPTKKGRTQARSFLKSLWLLESVRSLSSNSTISRPAQHAQRAMLTLLLRWVPALPGYPEATPLYLQLLSWVLHTTPALASQVESASSGSAKKKKTSTSQKTPPTKEGKPTASDDSLRRGGGFSQSDIILAELSGMFAALQAQNSVLADHSHRSTYHLLQVIGSLAASWSASCPFMTGVLPIEGVKSCLNAYSAATGCGCTAMWLDKAVCAVAYHYSLWGVCAC